MPRIRSIKPEYWTSEQVMTCSPNARLLFIGLWNFVDDNGVHPASVISLKAQVYPGDPYTTDDIQCWVNELLHNELLREYVVEGKTYWIVTGWKRHQKIDRPQPGKYPLPMSNKSGNDNRTFGDSSSNSQRTFDDHSCLIGEDTIGEDRIGEDRIGEAKDADNKTDDINKQNDSTRLDCSHEEIIKLFHEILPMCPSVRIWNKTRRGYLKQRWREDPKHQSLDWWRNYFEFVKQSEFLIGKTLGSGDKPPFVADLEWLVRPNNFAKVIEGKYHHGVSQS